MSRRISKALSGGEGMEQGESGGTDQNWSSRDGKGGFRIYCSGRRTRT